MNAQDAEVELWRGDVDSPAALIPILSQSHGRVVSEQWVRAKFARADAPAVAALAMSGGIATGVVAFGLNEYRLNERPVRVGLSYDTYVAAHMRGRGLFMRLLSAAETASRESGADMLLNFPNGNSRPGFEKAGWEALDPCLPYVHLTRHWFANIQRSYKSLINARGEHLVPDSAESLSPRDVKSFVAKQCVSKAFQMSLAEEQVVHRFDGARGEGYALIEAKSAAAVARVGNRGGLREVQLLALAPRLPTAKMMRSLCAVAIQSYSADIVSYLSSMRPRRSTWLTGAGFVRLPANTIPYVKLLSDSVSVEEYVISGVDIHTW